MKRPAEITINDLVYTVVGAVYQNGKFTKLKLLLKQGNKPKTVN